MRSSPRCESLGLGGFGDRRTNRIEVKVGGHRPGRMASSSKSLKFKTPVPKIAGASVLHGWQFGAMLATQTHPRFLTSAQPPAFQQAPRLI